MQTKLTLRLDDELIRRAKHYASETGTSLSQLVAAYFFALTEQETKRAASLTPLVASLMGSLQGAEVDEDDYRRHLEEKYL